MTPPADNTSPSFLDELKRRRILRSALLYAVFWWLLLLLLKLVYPAAGLDEASASRLFLWIAVAGFPVYCLLAWFFRLAPRAVSEYGDFVERRVLRNMAPINDRRRGSRLPVAAANEDLAYRWIVGAENGPLAGLRYAISGPVVIGSSEQCDLTIAGGGLSQRHARLDIVADTLTVEDLGSDAGTQVNDAVIAGRQALRAGDLLRLHDILFRIAER